MIKIRKIRIILWNSTLQIQVEAKNVLAYQKRLEKFMEGKSNTAIKHRNHQV